MQTLAEERRLPVDIDAQPPVQAAAALRPVIRGYHEEIEREQRLPKALVEQLHAAGFYRLVIPRQLGGLQADPLTYLRVVELLSEGAGSVGWNLANNSIGQLVTLGLPDEGVHEIYAHGADTVIAGTAVQGGGQAVSVALPLPKSFAVASLVGGVAGIDGRKDMPAFAIDAYALASVAMDCRVGAVADGGGNIHCLMPKSLWQKPR